LHLIYQSLQERNHYSTIEASNCNLPRLLLQAIARNSFVPLHIGIHKVYSNSIPANKPNYKYLSMPVKIVTDSCSDITQEEAKKLGIAVVPAYVHFGNEVYRDGVDIDCERFWEKLATSSVHPCTAAPSPGDFTSVYEEIAKETSEIVSIHVTRKHSAMYDSAMVAKNIAAEKGIKIEVIDSRGVTLWQGLVAMAAAKAARDGGSLQQVVDKTHKTINQMHALALLDTLKYVIKGGRVGNTIFAVESKLSIKPLITLVNGEIRPAGLTRNRAKGINRLRAFIAKTDVNEIAIVHSTAAEEAQGLADYARSLLPNIAPRIDRLGPALGVHAGPGALAIIVKSAGRVRV
jgi:DegV family protein with EDD domain